MLNDRSTVNWHMLLLGIYTMFYGEYVYSTPSHLKLQKMLKGIAVSKINPTQTHWLSHVRWDTVYSLENVVHDVED